MAGRNYPHQKTVGNRSHWVSLSSRALADWLESVASSADCLGQLATIVKLRPSTTNAL